MCALMQISLCTFISLHLLWHLSRWSEAIFLLSIHLWQRQKVRQHSQYEREKDNNRKHNYKKSLFINGGCLSYTMGGTVIKSFSRGMKKNWRDAHAVSQGVSPAIGQRKGPNFHFTRRETEAAVLLGRRRATPT